MQQGIPGSAPPARDAYGSNDLGPQVGTQSSQVWQPHDPPDSRPVLSVMRAPHLWRVTALGTNVKLLISYGTSANKRLVDILTPCRITLPGSVDIYAQPAVIGELGNAADVKVTLTPVTSGCCESECRKVVRFGDVLDVDAVRFVALENSGVTINGIAVALTTLQSVSLIAGSVLTSGAGFLEFEP